MEFLHTFGDILLNFKSKYEKMNFNNLLYSFINNCLYIIKVKQQKVSSFLTNKLFYEVIFFSKLI